MILLPARIASGAPAILAVLPGALIAALLFSISLTEWVNIALLADPATLAMYPFGVEEAMADGGWYYRNAATYGQQMLIYAAGMLSACILFARAFMRRTRFRIALAYGVLILTLLALALISGLHD